MEIKLPSPKDTRAMSISRSQLGLENQSLVFSVFEDGVKLTVNDVVEAVNSKLAQKGQPNLHERTVRRAIDALEKKAFIQSVGRQQTAILYAKQGTEITEDAALIPLPGELVSVEKFLRLFAENEEPFRLKVPTLTQSASLHLRQQLLFAIISAGHPGYSEALKHASKNLRGYLREIEHIQAVLKTFLDSPVWYEQYRDKIGYNVRRAEQSDAELIQLCRDIIQGSK
jgi:hypothetical protein